MQLKHADYLTPGGFRENLQLELELLPVRAVGGGGGERGLPLGIFGGSFLQTLTLFQTNIFNFPVTKI